MAKIKLYEDRILIKVDVPETGGVILPDSVKLQQGEVVAVGPGKNGEFGMRTKVGDHVRFGTYGIEEISLHGEDFILTREEYIIGKI
jgi:chaperonin GroES